MDELRRSFGEFRDKLISDKEGSNAERLAFALGFFEALVIKLCRDQKNFNIVQRQITRYMDKK